MTDNLATELTGTDWLALAIAAVALLGGVKLTLAVLGDRRLRELWRGQDGRASTSKFQAVLWTMAVAWALLSLLVAELIASNTDSALSIGWDVFTGERVGPNRPADAFQADYLVLLGLPIGTAAGVKAVTSVKVANGTVVKPVAKTGEGLRRQALYLIADDRGRPAVLDFQLVVFNLLLLAFFAGTLLNDPTKGLPNLPETLLALAGVSTASYGLNKVLEKTSGPPITSVRPSRVSVGARPAELDIHGGPFGVREDTAEDPEALTPEGHTGGVTLAGVTLEISHWENTRVKALVPPQPEAGRAALPLGVGELIVYDTSGIASAPERVELVAGTVADRPSDDLLGEEATARAEQQLDTEHDTDAQEDALVAVTAAADDEPGESHLADEPVRPDTDDDL